MGCWTLPQRRHWTGCGSGHGSCRAPLDHLFQAFTARMQSHGQPRYAHAKACVKVCNAGMLHAGKASICKQTQSDQKQHPSNSSLFGVCTMQETVYVPTHLRTHLSQTLLEATVTNSATLLWHRCTADVAAGKPVDIEALSKVGRHMMALTSRLSACCARLARLYSAHVARCMHWSVSAARPLAIHACRANTVSPVARTLAGCPCPCMLQRCQKWHDM